MHKISMGGLGAREVRREQVMIVIHVLVQQFPMEIMTGPETCDCQNSEGRLSESAGEDVKVAFCKIISSCWKGRGFCFPFEGLHYHLQISRRRRWTRYDD